MRWDGGPGRDSPARVSVRMNSFGRQQALGAGVGWPQISQISLGQAFQPDGLTSKAGQSLTGVVTALLSAAIPARREMAEESRFLVFVCFHCARDIFLIRAGT